MQNKPKTISESKLKLNLNGSSNLGSSEKKGSDLAIRGSPWCMRSPCHEKLEPSGILGLPVGTL